MPAPAGNMRSGRHGVYSARVVAPRAAAFAEDLKKLPHVIPIDEAACDEIGSLIARLEAIDADLESRGHFGKSGVAARTLLAHRARLSSELRAWLREVGATPRSRFEYAGRLAEVEAYRRRLSEDA